MRTVDAPYILQELTSNELELTIVDATPEWQEETLEWAVGTIAKVAPLYNEPSDSAKIGEAMRALRFLDTPAAARELAHRASNPYLSLGLVGSPERAAGLEEMKKMLRDPLAPIDDRFLVTMSVLALLDGLGDRYAERWEIEQGFRQELAARVQ